MRVAFLGATGSVGTWALHGLLASSPVAQQSTAVLINRRNVALSAVDGADPGPDRVTQHVLSMPSASATGADQTEQLDRFRQEVQRALEGADSALMTLGMGKPSKASSAEEFEFVERSIPLAFGRGARAAGVKHVGLMTSTGADSSADPDSWATKLFGTGAGGPVYLHVKGAVEDDYRDLGFASLSVFRPSMLVGSPNTPVYASALASVWDMVVPANLRSVHVSDLGHAMAFDAEQAIQEGRGGDAGGPKVNVFEGNALFALIETARATHDRKDADHDKHPLRSAPLGRSEEL